jgi:proteasome lid subunit RPN8/RPN11
MTEIHKVLLEQICINAEKSYPDECCGLLMGTSHSIKEIRPVENASNDSKRRRYLIHPKDLMDAENYGLGIGMEVIGVYHSHPDHPAHPSAFDNETAVPQYLYLIVNVTQGRSGDVTCWRMGNWGSGFEPEALNILG